MTTKFISLLALCTFTGLLLIACAGSSDNAANTSNAANGSTTASAGDKVGVAECDDFIAKYEACVNSKVPESARSMVKANLESMRKAWRDAAKTPQGKAGLAQGCKAALDQAKTTLGTYGCSW
jgi:hypothetical protein